jgi:repressor LexA
MPITPKQQRIYNFIRGYIQSNKEAPTIAEIGRQLQMRSSASVHAVLAVLKHEGLITIVPNVSRGIRLVESTAAGVALPENF